MARYPNLKQRMLDLQAAQQSEVVAKRIRRAKREDGTINWIKVNCAACVLHLEKFLPIADRHFTN